MLALKYSLGVVIFCGVFLLGKLMIELGGRWAGSLSYDSLPAKGLRNFFHYGGRIFQLVAVVWGFLDAVSVLVLVL